jgi:hypothetical protein
MIRREIPAFRLGDAKPLRAFTRHLRLCHRLGATPSNTASLGQGSASGLPARPTCSDSSVLHAKRHNKNHTTGEDAEAIHVYTKDALEVHRRDNAHTLFAYGKLGGAMQAIAAIPGGSLNPGSVPNMLHRCSSRR